MMSNEIWIGTLVPFLGTILGSAMVFFSKKEIPVRIEKSLLGFARSEERRVGKECRY